MATVAFSVTVTSRAVSMRWEQAVLDRLQRRARLAGWSVSALAQRYVDEGLRVANGQDFRNLLARALHEGEPVAPLLLVHPTRFLRNRRAGRQLPAALRRWLIRGDQASDEDWLTHDR